MVSKLAAVRKRSKTVGGAGATGKATKVTILGREVDPRLLRPMPKRVFEITLTTTVCLTVHDPDVLARCVEDKDGWRSTFYPLFTEQSVVEHVVFNHVMNGVEHVSSLDGWADVAKDAVTFDDNRDY